MSIKMDRIGPKDLKTPKDGLLVLKLVLKGTVASKKNSPQIAKNQSKDLQQELRRRWLIDSARYRKWAAHVKPTVLAWMQQQAKKYDLVYPLAHVKLTINFYFPDLKKRDGPNKEESICEILKVTGFIEDDCWTCLSGCTWTPYLDRKNPRTEVFITVLQRERSAWMDHLLRPSRKKAPADKKRLTVRFRRAPSNMIN